MITLTPPTPARIFVRCSYRSVSLNKTTIRNWTSGNELEGRVGARMLACALFPDSTVTSSESHAGYPELQKISKCPCVTALGSVAHSVGRVRREFGSAPVYLARLDLQV